MKISCIKNVIQNFTICSGLCMLFSILMSTPLYSQVQGKEDLRIHEKLFSEELRISTDRDLYVAGEKVWIKIYKLNGLTHTPANMSKVVYVDILDLENNPVNQLKIEMNDFSGSCDLTLPDTLRSGNYILRSYTNWMENFSKDLFASKRISVINPFDKLSNLKVPPSVQNPDSVIFYPEGGHLQAGLESRLGFKCIARNGEPVLMSGVVTDDNNDTLCHVKTGINGYGIISLQPSGQKHLYLLSSVKNLPRKFPLPAVQKSGILLTTPANTEDSRSIVKMNFSHDYLSKDNQLFLVINSSGLSGFKKEINPGNVPELNISGNELPYGISHLMVVDGPGKILTDRWISKENPTQINYKIDPGNKGHAKREKIRIDITATDNSGNPVETDFSISVAKDIATGNTGLKSGKHRQMAELLPVSEDCNTAGINEWLIFYKAHETVSDRNGNKSAYNPAFLPELDGHLISGTIKERISGEPLKRESVTLSFVGKTASCLFTKTDSTGNFNFVTKEKGIQEIVIQPLISEKEYYVDLKNSLPSGYGDYDHGILSPDTSRLNEINNLIISMQINSIYEPFYQKAVKSTDNNIKRNFYGNPDNSIIMSNYIELTSVKEIITELIPGVGTTRNNGKINFRLTKQLMTRPFEEGPLVLVDGVPVYDLEKVIGISANDIKKVDVLIDRYYITGNVLCGILHFITKKGNLSAIDLDKSIFRMEYDLLKIKDPFFSPDYSIDTLKNNRLPDFRNTLYWNPELHTDRDGKASVEFYSSDEQAEYIVNVEGITADGIIGTASLPLIIKSK